MPATVSAVRPLGWGWELCPGAYAVCLAPGVYRWVNVTILRHDGRTHTQAGARPRCRRLIQADYKAAERWGWPRN